MVMKKNFLLSLLIVICFDVSSQISMNALDSTIAKWKYFLPKKAIKVVLIKYVSAFSRGNRVEDNSMAIALTERSDTIRIIELCPGKKLFYPGDTLVLKPEKHLPKNKNPGLAYINGKPNPFIFNYPTIKKTTYGYLTSISPPPSSTHP